MRRKSLLPFLGSCHLQLRGEFAVIEFENDRGNSRYDLDKFSIFCNYPTRIIHGDSWDIAQLGGTVFGGPRNFVPLQPSFHLFGMGVQMERPLWARYAGAPRARIFIVAIPWWLALLVLFYSVVLLVRRRKKSIAGLALSSGFPVTIPRNEISHEGESFG